jgi:hypothetical protein
MIFKTYGSLGSLTGVFQGKYSKHGPFASEDDARRFATKYKFKEAYYVSANYSLYVPKTEVQHDTHDDGFKTVILFSESNKDEKEIPARTLPPTFPKPKPSGDNRAGEAGTTIPARTNWFGHE